MVSVQTSWNQLSPPKALFTRNTRFSNVQHPFAVKLDKNRTSAFANSFIPLTSRDWNSLPATVFPATYNLQLFKTRIHRHLHHTSISEFSNWISEKNVKLSISENWNYWISKPDNKKIKLSSKGVRLRLYLIHFGNNPQEPQNGEVYKLKWCL